jgi:autotransporter-associated beta strand protein
MTYQWYRNGTALTNGGNISGATTSQLVISPAGTGDVVSGANGYYVKVTGAGPYSTNSVTNSLAFVAAKNLIYSGSGAWDLNTSASWYDSTFSTLLTFNYGDAVTFDDNGGGGIVNLNDSYLSASSVKVSHTGGFYTFQGTGSFAGPGSLIYDGSGQLTINNANTYTGGTVISNANANLRLQNLNGLGTGPVTLAKAGGKMEVLTTGGSSSGIQGDVVVKDDFTILFDGTGAYAGVFLGNLSGDTGKTLTLDQPDDTTTNRYRVYGDNTVYDGNLVLNGAATSQANYVGTVLAPYTGGTQIYNGVISGPGGVVQRGNGTTILAGANTYSGGTTPTTGTIGFGSDSTGNVDSGPIGTGALFIAPELPNTSGSGTVLAYGGARTIANPLQYPSGTNNQTLIVGGTNNLTFSGPVTLNGLDGVTSGSITTRTFQIANTGATTISGVISDGGSAYGFTKTGAGSLYLNGANTYTGPTTDSAGLLAGNGSLTSAVTVQSGASIGGGSAAAIGTLTINGDLTLNGNGFFRVNRSGLASDKVSVSGALANGGTGTVTVTNLGAALAIGDKFTLFSKPVANGGTLTVTGGGAAVNWANNLATDGSITVASITSTTPPVLTNSVSGGVLHFEWPADHLGWTLQAQTNSLATGLSSNWVTIPGTESVTSTNFPVNAANGSVFYRLIYNP